MRHRKKTVILDRKTAGRKALLKLLALSLIKHGRIKTTSAKAKALRNYIEPLLSKAKKGGLTNFREINKHLNNPKAAHELIKKWAVKLKDRKSGYTRITKIGYRRGDGAEISLIEIL